MTRHLNSEFTLLGRILIALLFVPAGFSKIMDFSGTVQYIASVGMPFAPMDAVFAIIIEVGAGLAVLLGWHTRIAAVVLALFTLMASVLFHPYWSVAADQAYVTELLFYKNIAIIGGLFALAASGPGRWSIEAKRAA